MRRMIPDEGKSRHRGPNGRSGLLTDFSFSLRGGTRSSPVFLSSIVMTFLCSLLSGPGAREDRERREEEKMSWLFFLRFQDFEKIQFQKQGWCLVSWVSLRPRLHDVSCAPLVDTGREGCLDIISILISGKERSPLSLQSFRLCLILLLVASFQLGVKRSPRGKTARQSLAPWRIAQCVKMRSFVCRERKKHLSYALTRTAI